MPFIFYNIVDRKISDLVFTILSYDNDEDERVNKNPKRRPTDDRFLKRQSFFRGSLQIK